MEFVKNKYFYWGILTGFLWTSFGVIILLFFLLTIKNKLYSISSLYNQNKLGGLISLAALINLPIFFVALKKNKFEFATGLVAISVLFVIIIALLKINF